MNKKMIILEGCDGSGKSTLAKVLARELHIPVADRAVTSENGPPSKAELIRWTYKELADPTPKIYDRFPIYSEPIYARTLNRELKIGPAMVNHFHELYTPFLILCDPGYSRVEQNVRNEVQMPGVLDHLGTLYGQYRQLPFIDYVYDHDDERLGVSFMLELINDYLEN